MIEKIYSTNKGDIHYWVSDQLKADEKTLVFLPGLTADHRLFDLQIAYFEERNNVFVWDAPGHAASWPFELDFRLKDKAIWLKEILDKEGITQPVIVGQSMGGYVGQAFTELYPDILKGFVSIDSAPLQKKYVTGIERWLLKLMEPVYYYYPWKSLLKTGTSGVATSDYGRKLMYDIMMVYDGDKRRYARLSGHGMWMLADAMEEDLPYQFKCPVALVCGTKDMAGSCKRYSRNWHKNTGYPLHWIEGAGHNSNTDAPEQINQIIEGILINDFK